jgi:O-antigen ligase
MIAASRSLSTWLNPEGMYVGVGDIESGNPVDRFFFSSLIAASFWVLYRRKIGWKKFASKNVWLVALILFAAFSIIWSDVGMVSLKRWIRCVGSVLAVLVILSEDDYVEASKRLFRRCAYALVPLSILFIKYYRGLGVGWDYFGNTMWYGVATHKNSLGQLCCFSAMFFSWSVFENRKNKNYLWWADLSILAMSLFLLRGSGMSSSKTSILLFVLGLSIFAICKLLRNPATANKLMIGLLFLFLVVQTFSALGGGDSFLAMIISSSGRNETLTGRTLLWNELIRMSPPILGAGYGAFWNNKNILTLGREFEWGPESAHNGFLDVYLDLGFCGILLLTAFIVHSYSRIHHSLTDSFGLLRLIFFVICVFYNITESSILRPSSLLWIVMLIVTLSGTVDVCEKKEAKRGIAGQGSKESALSARDQSLGHR